MRANPFALQSKVGNTVVRSLRSLLGLRRRLSLEDTTYIERSPDPLQKALAEQRSKVFDVHFKGSPPMRIRVAHDRPYPDLTGHQAFLPYTILGRVIRPGTRVLDMRCRCGYGASLIAQLVGPSGGVVALDTDHEFIRYARRRYPSDQLGFENGGIEALSGELDGAFEAVVYTIADYEELHQLPDAKTIRELWRVTAPSGSLVLLAHIPRESDREQALIRLLRSLPDLASAHADRMTTSTAAAFVASKRPFS